MKNKYIWILAAFAALVALLAVGLTRDPREIPSPFIGKPAPDFRLTRLAEAGNESNTSDETFAPADMRGQVWLLNVWASWCFSCREEHPVLLDLAQKNLLPIVGLNYKEVRGDASLDASGLDAGAERQLASERAQQWLTTHGDPYTLSVLDLDGQVGIDYGVYGVPETYLIDREGIIRFKQIGPISKEILEGKILPLV
ncbi:MAG: DsbE family thiol:disulfide interchange protein, partial [Zoogloeaceae bacterium]|nr:DsbE family thiol:disulfide interchange protein [Zoogloeaceae bacterium]